MRDITNLRVDGARLWDALMAMAQIGPTPKGGSQRLALSDLDREARDLFAHWAGAAGCQVGVDRMGNMFARRAGADASLPPVIIGSHLDTQPTGGKFDGVLGVLGALEVVRTLNDLGIRTRHPIELVNWTNEEGSRFAPAMLSSAVFAGIYSEAFAASRLDRQGVSLGDELARIGYRGPEPVGGRPMRAYFELHIEQGPILEDEGFDIGIVTHGQGQRWFEIDLTGFESHAGSTPMARRKDALVAAARIVEAVHQIGLTQAPEGVATVGMLEAFPNSRNVIPGRVFMTVDLRHPREDALAAMAARLAGEVEAIGARAAVAPEMREIFTSPPVAFDAECIATLRRVAASLGYRQRAIVSGAGHDACNIARVAPAAMIFTPCVGGISHHESEDITPRWAEAGTNVLLLAVLETAEIVA